MPNDPQRSRSVTLNRLFESRHEDGDTLVRLEEQDGGTMMLSVETFWIDLGEADASMSIQLSAKQVQALRAWLVSEKEPPNNGVAGLVPGEPSRAPDHGEMDATRILLWCVTHEGECLGDHPAMLAKAKAALGCGCAETYPQLVRGKVSHGPGCRWAK